MEGNVSSIGKINEDRIISLLPEMLIEALSGKSILFVRDSNEFPGVAIGDLGNKFLRTRMGLLSDRFSEYVKSLKEGEKVHYNEGKKSITIKKGFSPIFLEIESERGKDLSDIIKEIETKGSFFIKEGESFLIKFIYDSEGNLRGHYGNRKLFLTVGPNYYFKDS